MGVSASTLDSAPFASPEFTINQHIVVPVVQVGAPGSTYAAVQLPPSIVKILGGGFQSPPTTQGALPMAARCLPTLPLRTLFPSS
eukprot:3350648-Heterocapsa_arctica.AAC.1